MYQVNQYLFYNGHMVLNNTAHFVYSPLNSYVYTHWILHFKYILLLYVRYYDVVKGVVLKNVRVQEGL